MLTIFGSLRLCVEARDRQDRVIGIPMQFADSCLSAGGLGALQAHAARRFGVATHLFGCVGDDALAKRLLEPLHRAGVDLVGVQTRRDYGTGVDVLAPGRRAMESSVALRIEGANAFASQAQVPEMVLHASEVVLVGTELDSDESLGLARRANAAGCKVAAFLSSAVEDPVWFEPIDLVVAAEAEFFKLCAMQGVCHGDPMRDAQCVARRFGVDLIVLLRRCGAVLARAQGECGVMPAPPDGHYDAGPSPAAYAGVLCAAVSSRHSIERAMAMAAVAAQQAAGSHSEATRFPTRAEIETTLFKRSGTGGLRLLPPVVGRLSGLREVAGDVPPTSMEIQKCQR